MNHTLKQTSASTLVTYIGVIIGYANTIYVFPRFLTIEEIGLYRLILSNASLLVPIATAGMPATIIKFFPYFKDNQNGLRVFNSFVLIVPILAFTAIAGLILLGLPWIKVFFEGKGEAYLSYIHVSGIIIFFMLFVVVFESLCRVHNNILLPNVLREVVLRLFATATAVTVGIGLWSFSVSIYLMTSYYAIASVSLWIFLRRKHLEFQLFKIPKIRKLWRRRILDFAGFSSVMGFGTLILLNIDQLFITKYLGTSQNGIYTTCFFIAILIEIPKRVILQIAGPQIARDFKAKKMDNISSLFKRASIDQTLLGVLIFLGILLSIDDLFAIIPKGNQFAQAKMVIIIVGFAKVSEMLFSVNTPIIVYSQFYRFNVLFIAVFAVLNIALNVFLIPIYGLNGAAMSSLISSLLFNGIKILFIHRRIRINPFSSKLLPIAFVGFATFLIVQYAGLRLSPIFNVVVKSLLIVIIYGVPLYFLRVSKNYQQLVKAVINRFN